MVPSALQPDPVTRDPPPQLRAHRTLEEAASVPVVYTTAYYALVVRGRIQPGESVLIHSGSGGVGQAAITIALSLGCRVFTTVGESAGWGLTRLPSLVPTHPPTNTCSPQGLPRSERICRNVSPSFLPAALPTPGTRALSSTC